MQQYNWGIIGPGHIANTFADAIAFSSQGKITAVASRSVERAKDFAHKYQIPKVYNQYTDLVNDPDINIVYIATPHSFHYEQAILCLEAGKHVLVEKAATVTAPQIKRLVELAQSKGLLLQEALWSRFAPCLSQLKQKLDQGVIGEIQYINSNIGFAFQGRRESRLFKPELAGGSLLDLGVYSIALSQFLLDEDPEKIQALGQIGNTQVDTNIIVNMLYPSGRLSQFTCTMLGQASNTMTIVGSKGHVILPAYFWDVNEAQIFNDEILTDSISIPHLVNGFEYQIEESMRCIAAGKNFSDLMSHQASVGIMQVMDEVRSQIGLVYDHAIERL